MLTIRRIHGESMAPTYSSGTIIVVLHTWHKLRVGDVVIVVQNGIEKVKRINQLTIDKVFVRGDNSGHSTDSRHFGWLDVKAIHGKVIWPLNKQNAPVKQQYQK